MPLLLPPALERSLDLLRARPAAPDHCGATALRCPTGHTYGIARCGCASLLTGRRATSGGDTAMARARDRFLATGSYAPVRARRWRLAAAALPDRGAVGPVEARGPRPGSPSSAATSPNDPCLSRPEPRHGSRKEAEPEHMTAWSEPVIRCRVTRPTPAGRHPGSSTVFPIVPLASIARCAAAAALSGKR